MKILTLTSKGFEAENALEIKELTKRSTKSESKVNIFDIDSYEDLARFCYFTQTSERVLILLDEKPLNKLNDFKIEPDSKLLNKTFALRVITEDHVKDLEKEIGGLVGEKLNLKVNLDNPDTLFLLVLTEDKAYLGIDFCQRDLSKRDYRIFTHVEALKATVAASLLYKHKLKDITLLDPFAGSGTIVIEAALKLSSFSPFHYSKDQLKFPVELDLEQYDTKPKIASKIYCYDKNANSVEAIKKNAKIAGINKLLNISKIEVEWLDTKFDKESVDLIITQPPGLTKHSKPDELKKTYKEFFYQTEFVLKNDGKLITIMKNSDLLKECMQNYKFKVTEEKIVKQGKQDMVLLVIEKN